MPIQKAVPISHKANVNPHSFARAKLNVLFETLNCYFRYLIILISNSASYFKNPKWLPESQKGQGLVEYLILVCLVCVASISILRVLGQNITAKFSQISNSIQGKNANDGGVQFDEVRESHYKKRDLSNFFQGAASRGKNESD